jgi:hypothetical protein
VEQRPIRQHAQRLAGKPSSDEPQFKIIDPADFLLDAIRDWHSI